MSQAHAYRFGFLSARQIRRKNYIRRFRRCDCSRPNKGAGVRMGEELKSEVNEHRKRLLRGQKRQSSTPLQTSGLPLRTDMSRHKQTLQLIRLFYSDVEGGGPLFPWEKRWRHPNCATTADHRRQISGDFSSTAVCTMTSFEGGSTRIRCPRCPKSANCRLLPGNR